MPLIRYAAAAQLVVLVAGSFSAEAQSRRDYTNVAPSSFYLGVQGGMAWAKDRMQQYKTPATAAFDMEMGSDAAFGGLHVGYQRTIDNVIVGFEADYDRGGQKGKATYTDATPITFNRNYQMDYRSTLRARLGYDFGDFSVYATGGGALTNVRLTNSASAAPAGQSENAFGFGAAVGAGLVYKLSRHWAAFSEYRYVDFGRNPVASESGTAVGGKAQHRVTETSVRAGATYYFR